jgi:hypothetical protein
MQKVTLYFSQHEIWVEAQYTDKKSLYHALHKNPGPGAWWNDPVQIFNTNDQLVGRCHLFSSFWSDIVDEIFEIC